MNDRDDERAADDAAPPHRYTAALANAIESRWQDRWERDGTFHTPNPVGPLARPEPTWPAPATSGAASAVAEQNAEKLYVLDFFPYTSDVGLHVGHPLGYIGTDTYARFHRMAGRNVLHTMGLDAFGLPAEQYAIQTGTHPRITTEANIAKFRRQLRRLGLAHDPRRSVVTSDPSYYRWTQWIFLKLFNSWYDPDAGRARPIDELIESYASGRHTLDGRRWADLDDMTRRRIVDDHRLAYVAEAPVNWCPGLGTVLADAEVTADGRSERGNFPVFKRTMRQWLMRITAYADRLDDDLDRLDWPEPIKAMQRNWIGRSAGAFIDFGVVAPTEPAVASTARLRVFTTRPDTVFGATFVAAAPEHPIVDALTPTEWPDRTPPEWTGGHADPRAAVTAYRGYAAGKSDVERAAAERVKTGVFTGAYATNPASGARIPIFVADYVASGYGTGAIMGVPGQDDRDWAFAVAYGLPIVRTVQPPDGFDGDAYPGEGPAINSRNAPAGIDLDGLSVADAKARIIDWLEQRGHGERAITHRLRDWLFSRQRYWGEPFPIVYDDTGLPIALPESMLPVELPEMDDFTPKTYAIDDADSNPEAPLSRATDWVDVTLDLGDGRGVRRFTRETNVMPQWAGSCWYELRYLDPCNDDAFVDPDVERYWMGPRAEPGAALPNDTGGVDLYVGGVEQAVLHLLYARFWHKVLFDLGYVSSYEPFRRLYNQGYIQAYAYADARGAWVPAAEVVERDGRFFHGDTEVTRHFGKMGKSLRNGVSPDAVCDQYGADTFRVYEMSMAPLDVSRPWETRAVVGAHRFLQRLWRLVVDEHTGAVQVSDDPADGATADAATTALLHRAIDAVRADYAALRFNTAIAKLIGLTNHLTGLDDPLPRSVVEPLVLMVAPVAPHVAEELWSRLGHAGSLAYQAFPVADPAWTMDATVTMPVQINGKVRARIQVAPDADETTVRSIAIDAIGTALDGRVAQRVIVVPGRVVSVVV
ncbi:MAG TPA: leucine--tRNA ligase [Micromonosporaceae bacterium]|nr:leucine--tRNA ligase [Micromonosporaceae bacterium]